jgi:hypothetical protein
MSVAGAVTALVDLHRTSIRIFGDDPAAPGHLLVLAQHWCRKRSQSANNTNDATSVMTQMAPSLV